MGIKENLDTIKQNIGLACERCGRDKTKVGIVAVTKYRSADEINEAISLGINNIGENRVQEMTKTDSANRFKQEMTEKYPHIKGNVKWHIIGHLQTNKVKYIADKADLIHSVDSLKLALEIDRQCKKINKVMDILIEVNSGEENKNGVAFDEAEKLTKEISHLTNVRIKGLMTMAPLGADEATLRRVFSSLYKLSVDIDSKKYDNVSMNELSMGMSGDYMIAIEEGATLIRPGRSLFE